ncbi:MAG: polysaccharide biosynthesis/export family protein [Verrucomicrobia bacterium]|nr:polysaccharide biosynthesis/export family protein [Verrucomicrobiota bacterium]
MNFRQCLKIVGLSGLAVIAAGSLGCGILGGTKIPEEKKFTPTTQYSAPDVAKASVFRPADNLAIRLDTATGREEHVKTVDEDGNIELPFVGKMKMVNLTVSQAQEVIRKAYVPRYYSYLVVTVVLQTPRMVYMSGELRGQGGGVPYRDDMTIYRLIMSGGGFSEFAKRREVVLTRDGKRTIVDCLKIEQNPELDIPLLPGDSIYIPKSAF